MINDNDNAETDSGYIQSNILMQCLDRSLWMFLMLQKCLQRKRKVQRLIEGHWIATTMA